jgi:NAD(P)-dependent dehydrogenase (short-subunit alcohol dehydrogenase family)
MPHPKPVALITGGSRGIGRGIALALAEKGYDQVINFHQNQTAAEEVAHQCQTANSEVLLIEGDISQKETIARLFAETHSRFGRIDLLVSNAGIAPRVRLDLLETTEESFQEILHTNLNGPFFLAQAFAKWMLTLKQQGIVDSPRIVFISSISASVASVSRGEYCISKAGLAMVAQLFAVRLAPDIPVFEIRPGIIETDMTEKVKAKYDPLIKAGLVPQRRWGTPQDVAKVVVAIGKGTLDFSTGQIIEVGGGFSLRQL